MNSCRLFAACGLVWAGAAGALGQTSYPMVTRVEPTAVRRGTTVEVAINGGGNGGENFGGAFALPCQGPGLRGEVLSVEKVERPQGKGRRNRPRPPRSEVHARVTAEADCPLGPREVRVATAQGASSVGLVVVVDELVVKEADDAANDTPAGAQSLALPCAVSGVAGKTEDVDWYAFEAKAGARLTFTVWGNRLENKIHDLQTHFDPIVSLHDATGRELANDDNHELADPRLSFAFPRDGTYYLKVRDTTYGGNANWTYVLEATGGPLVTSVTPLAVNPGKSSGLTAKGWNFDATRPVTLEVPAATPRGVGLFTLATDAGPSLPVLLDVTDLPLVPEAGDAPQEAGKGQAVGLPAAVCGVLGAANDGDSYRVDVKKGQIYAFEVVSRRAGAATDPVLQVLNEKGEALAEADDSPGVGKDPRLEWTAVADGPVFLAVNDLHGRGDGFGYVLKAQAARPDFTIECDPDKVNVGPGNRVPLFVQVTRSGGFAGPVVVTLPDLPPGLSASPLTVAPEMTQGLVIVSAAEGVKPVARLLTLEGKAETAAGPLTRRGTIKQEIYMPGGGRSTYPVETLALVVTDPSDIKVSVSPTAVTLKPGESATLDVTVTRRAGFTQGVNLAVLLEHLGGVHANPLPKGVTVQEAGSKTLLSPTETKGKIVLTAAADAKPQGAVPTCVMGHVSINFVVKTAYASEPVMVGVAR